MTKNQKKLETLLMQCIEDQMNDPCRDHLNLVPGLANELISLWVNAGEGDASPDFEAEKEMSAEKDNYDESPAEEEKVISIPVEVELDNIFTGLDLISKKVSEINEDLRRTNASIDLASSGLDSLRRQLPTD